MLSQVDSILGSYKGFDATSDSLGFDQTRIVADLLGIEYNWFRFDKHEIMNKIREVKARGYVESGRQ